MRHHTIQRAQIEREMKKTYQSMDEEFSGCFNCGTWQSPTHAHLVPKSRRRDLIAEPRNIIHLCMDCHHQLDHSGSRDNLRRWPDILERIKELDTEYYEIVK